MLPKIEKIDKVSLLKAEQSSSKKGVNIYSITTPMQDVVRISLVFCAGVKYQTKPFVSSATANILTEGCGDYTSHEVAQILDFYGIYYDVSVDRDYTVITMCALGKFAEKSIELLSDIILRPKFIESECEVYAQKRKATLKIEREKMNVRAREEFVRTIFGENHDYALFSSADSYDDVRAKDLKDFYTQYYVRENLFVVLSGNIEKPIIDGVSAIADALPRGNYACRISPEVDVKVAVKRVENSDTVQTSLNIGRALFSRSHPDFIAMQMASTILGGYFSSRLMQNLREEHGFTYGAHAATVNLQDNGYFIISTELIKEHTDEAIEQTFIEIERLRTELVDEEELDMVKRVITGEVLRILDGPFGIADVAIENIQNGVTNSATEQMIEQINSITAERVREVAAKYLKKEDLSVVAYC